MDDAWQIVRWVLAAFVFAYLAVQVMALRRLKGDRKKRSHRVLIVMTVLMGVSDAIRDIFFFENRVAGKIGMLMVGGAAIVSTFVLVRMFAESPSDAADSEEGSERYIQSFKLS